MMSMRRAASAPLVILLAQLALAGCGVTKTVSVSGTPAPISLSATTSSSSSSSTPAAASGGTSATATTSTSVSATRTESAPAFTHQGGSSNATAAVAVVRAHGYTPNETAQYHPGQTLGVLVGTHTGSGDGYSQQAFFFVNGRYLGTDTSQPSATLRVVSQSDTQVTLGYPLYKSHDALCCPSGGEARVTFQLDNGRLTPLQPIPPAASQKGLSRQ
jgi:LppP/LprE lipoprotein